MTSKGLFGVQNSALHAAYSEQLFSLGLGLPLLHPYPVDLGDLLLGEVGYMDNGTFHRLYKAMSPNDNARQRTPRSYMPLSLSGSLGSKFTRDTIPIGPGAVCSEGITCLSKYDDVQRIGGRGVAFQAGRPSGSIMVLPEAATRYRLDCDSDRSIASYMLRHYQDWHEELSTSAPQNDTSSAKTLMLISGCVRSAHWANATFYGVDSTATVTFRRASEREHSSFTLASSSGELHHHSSLSSGTVGTVSHSGEWANPAWTQSEITLTPSRLKHALFLSYYKLRLRSPSSNYAQSRQVETDEHEDYVDYLLAYILRHSSAEAAAAHDGDVYALFEGNKIPRKHEFARFLEDLAPRIDVDQAGLVSIRVEGGLD
ncbi:hypothetical protein OBBRIDRAFT_529770 [Obba rivulosa]|uniref:Uncharacterized protein n=1 Tax=Obba rivulosa TaxID=1052685 RepID=A0A8E2B4B8_9APHY|nr:hypothetical protein OBBRIDRAFT_529770 [Obba rivulosa]